MAAGTLVLSAWQPEIAPLEARAGRRRGFDSAAVGVGAVDAAAGAARAIAELRPARVIFVGTAGAYAGAAAAGAAAVIGAAVVAGELCAVSTAALRGDAYLPAPFITRATSTRALAAALRRAAGGGRAMAVACPLAITRAAALGRRIAAATGAGLENLEAFAVARAARAARVPFAAVLGIANRVGPQAHAEWRANHRAASAAACAVVLSFLDLTAAPATRPSPRPRRR
jgi:purine-nucleoside phosphorylase